MLLGFYLYKVYVFLIFVMDVINVQIRVKCRLTTKSVEKKNICICLINHCPNLQSRWVQMTLLQDFPYSYFAFDMFLIKNAENTSKSSKNVTWIKTFIISMIFVTGYMWQTASNMACFAQGHQRGGREDSCLPVPYPLPPPRLPPVVVIKNYMCPLNPSRPLSQRKVYVKSSKCVKTLHIVNELNFFISGR